MSAFAKYICENTIVKRYIDVTFYYFMRNSLVVLLEVLFENRQATSLVFLTHMHASVSRAYSSASGV